MSNYEVHAKRAFYKTAGPLVEFAGVTVTPGLIEVSYRIHATGLLQRIGVKSQTIGRKAVELAAETVGRWASNKVGA
jgi:hypothetical protein